MRRERERNQLMAPTQNTPMDKRKMIFLRDQTLPPAHRTGEDYQSEINRALLKAGVPHWIRVREVKWNEKGMITGITTKMCTVDNLRKYEVVVVKAARMAERGIICFGENEAWQRLKIHGVPLNRYVGRGTNGLENLREIQAENPGVIIPIAARWLGRVPQLKERWASGIITASSVVFAVRREDTANRLLKEGVRICGNCFTVERYQEEWLDVQCSNCMKWGHIDSKCISQTKTKCNLCAEKHRTDQHQCQVVGCTKRKGQQCAHLIVKCPNCRGQHVGGSRACPERQKAKEEAKGWRYPEHHRNHQQVTEHHLHVPAPEAAIITENAGDKIIGNEPTEAPTAPETTPVVGNDIMIDN
jgi:hypothetical protein